MKQFFFFSSMKHAVLYHECLAGQLSPFTMLILLSWLKIFSQLLPCLIVTPLDCFWEGAIPLGPRYKVLG